METPQLSPGSLLQGRYQLRGLVASGGMGAVLQADDLRLGSPVAIKVAAAGRELHVRSLQNEARLLARLRHHGLPRVLDLFAENGQHFMVLEFLRGLSLGELLRQRGPQAETTVLGWADKLLNVLSYLHSQQPCIVHGDIKPENLFLTTDGEVILLDFGIAVCGSELRPPTTNFSYSTNYAPPEQLRGEPLDPRGDIFSTAVTLYQLLAGVCPADTHLRLQAAAQHRAAPLRPLHEVAPNVSLALSSVLDSALRLDVNQRPPSVVDLQKSLSAIPRAAAPARRPEPASPTADGLAETIRPAQPIALAAAAVVPTPTAKAPRYEIKKLLGQGGMGQVFKAVDVATQQDVVLKRLRPDVAKTALKQECAAIARLSHPNIIRLIDYDLESAEPFMAVEYIAGITLSAYIARHQPIAAPVAIELGKKLLSALCHAHESDVLHCDLKPENVLLIRDGEVLIPKILDFGLAIVEKVDDKGNTTGAGRLAGTPIYMAPEQFRGAVLSPACDVYSMALIIAEMLTGTVPFEFDGRDLPGIAMAKFDRPFALADLRNTVAALPAPIARALRQATAQDASQRLTAAELLQVLSEAVPAVPSPQIWAPLTSAAARSGSELPAGWFDSAGFVGGVSIDYRCTAETVGLHSRPHQALRISSLAHHTDSDFASLMQRCPAWHLGGSRLVLSGLLQTEEVSGLASLWLRIDGPGGKTLFFDNMGNRALRGTTAWTTRDIVIEVPRQALWMNYGILLSGRGTVRATDISLRVGPVGQEKQLSLYDSDGYE